MAQLKSSDSPWLVPVVVIILIACVIIVAVAAYRHSRVASPGAITTTSSSSSENNFALFTPEVTAAPGMDLGNLRKLTFTTLAGTPATVQNDGNADAVLTLADDQVAFGDLNNDNKPDAVAVIKEATNTGIVSRLVAIINNNGAPKIAAYTTLGTDTILNNFSIVPTSGIIEVGLREGTIVPTLSSDQLAYYQLVGDKLVLK